ncbi:hypothetical protein Daesc_005119 [Daldinia eschscholtzii]|uniref:Uncharacterized protein n=1 Tax=Daldinia eschscholtzii TaxID=292717 RepID=A0AAX6MJK7_9PEZI
MEDGTQSTLTYRLPAQTTPFAPSGVGPSEGASGTLMTMPSSCSLSVFCRGLSYYVYSLNTAARDAHPLAGQRCLGVQDLATDSRRVGYNEECWPENYFALFDNEWGELNGAPRSGNEGGASTAAFPGDRCLAGWTVACTTTVTAGGGGRGGSGDGGRNVGLRNEKGVDVGWGKNGSVDGNGNGSWLDRAAVELYPQAWCCPPGQWTCATATAEGDRQAPQRLCQSYLTGSTGTPIWMYWDPAYDTLVPDGSTSSPFEAYTWTAEVPGESDPAFAATVFRKVFPLVLSSASGGGSGDSGSGVDSSTGSNTDPGEESSSSSSSSSSSLSQEVDVTITQIVTLEPFPRTTTLAAEQRNRRMEPDSGIGQLQQLQQLQPGEHVLTSRCLVSVLLGAILSTAVISFFGFALAYRLRRSRRRERRHRPLSSTTAASHTAKVPLKEDRKFEVGVGVGVGGLLQAHEGNTMERQG